MHFNSEAVKSWSDFSLARLFELRRLLEDGTYSDLIVLLEEIRYALQHTRVESRVKNSKCALRKLVLAIKPNLPIKILN